MSEDPFRTIAAMLDPQPGEDGPEPSQPSDIVPAPGDLDPSDIDQDIVIDCMPLDHSDTANGQRLRAHFGRDLVVLKTDGDRSTDYITWVGDHWDNVSGNNAAFALAQKIGDLIKLEADHFPPKKGESDDALEGRKTRRRAFGVTSKNNGRLQAMLSTAAPHILRDPDAFNADPMVVATARHTLRFTQDPLAPADDARAWRYADVLAEPGHDRDDLITKVVPVVYDRDAKCPKWDAFLDRFLPVVPVRDCVQVFSGAGLLGIPLQYILFHYGNGANGKSVFMETLTQILGPLAVDLPAESIIGSNEKAGAAATPDLARLYGARTVRVSELNANTPLREDLIKKLTGGERIPVRNMYKGFFDFKPIFKAHMSGNEYPFMGGTDDGIWRRMAVIHWPVKIPEAERRSSIDVVAEFVAEAPGILNWLINGALRFLSEGFVVPDEVKAATKDYRDEMDPIGQFVADCVVAAPGETVTARRMYDAYTSWSLANAKKPLFETKFGKVMKDKLKKDDGRVRHYLDCALRDVPARPTRNPDEDFDANPRDPDR